jgi:hypothetical protein
MTALKEYERLEASGLWRADVGEQRRDVTISFGKTTLVIRDPAGRALTHWSMPAIVRANPGTMPALFTPDENGAEELEIEDEDMVSAIEKVRKALIKARPKPPRLRYAITAALIAGCIAAAAHWGPDALYQQTLAVVPAPKRAEIDAALLAQFQAHAGPACIGNTQTDHAISQLTSRLNLSDEISDIIVVQSLPSVAIALPGGTLLLDRAILETHDDVAVTAGYVVAALHNARQHDPLAHLLDTGGFRTTLTLLARGQVPEDVIDTYAKALTTTAFTSYDDPAVLDAFAAAQIPSTPFAEQNAPPIRAYITDDPMAGQSIPLILEDTDWLRLQAICGTS